MTLGQRIGKLGYRWIRWGLGGVFIYAGAVKLMNPSVFAVLIDAYGIVPELLLMPTAFGLIAFEIIAGIGLMADIKGSLTAITALLGLFIGVLVYGIWLGLDVDCGCFGPEDPEAEAFHGLRTALVRDLVMLAGVFYLYVWRHAQAIRISTTNN